MIHETTPRIHASRGVGMVEILVTLVILSIGLLGLAALQMTGLRSSNSSGYRTAAVMAATDLAERMRANPTGVFNASAVTPYTVANANDYLNLFNTQIAGIDCATAAAPAATCSATSANSTPASCTPAQMAQYDLYVWRCSNSGTSTLSSLPGVAVNLTCLTDSDATDAACSFGSTYRITVQWTEMKTATEGGQSQQAAVTLDFVP